MVAAYVLEETANIDGDPASYIAEVVWALPQSFPDPGQPVKIARLRRSKEEVDKTLEVVASYPARGVGWSEAKKVNFYW